MDRDDPSLPEAIAEGFVGPSGDAFSRLVAVMAALRAPGGCPWDAEQDHRSLARHLLEETYETLEAIDEGDPEALRDELGDLLLQVVFHANIAFEDGAFGIADVADGLREKLIRRHPHVFGDVDVAGADEVRANWDQIKAGERDRGRFDGIPTALPGLALAAKVLRRARPDWSHEERTAKLAEEVAEFIDEAAAHEPDGDRLTHELGDLLLAAVVVADHHEVDPEQAMRQAVRRFRERFEAAEAAAGADGLELDSLSPERWAEYWAEAKRPTT